MDISKYSINDLLNGVVACEKEQRYGELLEYINLLLLKDPNNSDFILYKIKAQEGLGILNNNIETIQKYIQMKSTDATGFLLLHKAYMSHGYLAGAIIALMYALSIEPDNDECMTVLLSLIKQVDPQYTKVKLNIMTTDRIGHLACEVEPLLRRTANENDCLYLFLSANNKIANQYLYTLIKSHSHVIEDTFLFNLYVSRPRLLDDYFFAEYPYDVNSISRGKSATEVSAKGYVNLVDIYHNSLPCLSIPEADVALAWQLLSKHGITSADKIVCLHVRDSDYLKKKFPQHDFSYHDYRDANIVNYSQAVEYLIEQGYKVIRIGSNSQQTLAVNSAHYLDFCQNRDKRHGDFLEVMLLSVCQFLLGTSSGPSSVSSIFDTPTLAVNVAPIHPPYSKYSRFIPKHLLKGNSGVNFVEIANGKKIADSHSKDILFGMSGDELQKHNFTYLENEAEDILLAVQEFEQQISDRKLTADLSLAQQAYLELLPDNYIYKACDSVVCDSFLQRYPELFK